MRCTIRHGHRSHGGLLTDRRKKHCISSIKLDLFNYGIIPFIDYRGDLGVDGWIILGRICRRWDVGIWTGVGWPRIETGGGRL